MFERFQVVVHGIGRDDVFGKTEAFNSVMPFFDD
jgi:hypothetical protein